MSFVYLEKAYNTAPKGVLWGSCINRIEPWYSLLAISHSFPMGVGLLQGHFLSLILFINFIDRISRHSQEVEGLQFSELRTELLLFADDVVPLAPWSCNLQIELGQFEFWGENQHP